METQLSTRLKVTTIADLLGDISREYPEIDRQCEVQKLNIRQVRLLVLLFVFSFVFQNIARAEPTVAETGSWLSKTIAQLDTREKVWNHEGPTRHYSSYHAWYEDGWLFVAGPRGRHVYKREVQAIHLRSVSGYRGECQRSVHDDPGVYESCTLKIYSVEGRVFSRIWLFSDNATIIRNAKSVPSWTKKIPDWVDEEIEIDDYWEDYLIFKMDSHSDVQMLSRFEKAMDHLISINGNSEPF